MGLVCKRASVAQTVVRVAVRVVHAGIGRFQLDGKVADQELEQLEQKRDFREAPLGCPRTGCDPWGAALGPCSRQARLSHHTHAQYRFRLPAL